ncbi:hypothetical protein Nepgr_006789 [Nepenthes gracilis]|uniref:Uncharacterized protein n=1 Tax=Nepenthes gracilis TaxID=150966 RepID=A0AAD3XHP5_NEPGR|nr:hypothetical protein Nepgr_006789 [Nepenthes gracilis]
MHNFTTQEISCPEQTNSNRKQQDPQLQQLKNIKCSTSQLSSQRRLNCLKPKSHLARHISRGNRPQPHRPRTNRHPQIQLANGRERETPQRDRQLKSASSLALEISHNSANKSALNTDQNDQRRVNH